MRKQRRILCFGDSNTFGWIASTNGPTRRFPPDIRWTGRLASSLGSGWEIIEEGLGGRTIRDNFTVGDGISLPGAGLSGIDYLPACILSHLPLDAVVIMLGSNDMKAALDRSAEDIAEGMGMLIDIVQDFPWSKLLDYPAPKLLVISPPLIGQRKLALAGERYAGAMEKSLALAGLYRELAKRKGTHFLDAASVLSAAPAGEAHGCDAMHLDQEDHSQLADAVCHKIREMFNA